MKIVIPPEEFHEKVLRETGLDLPKTVTYFLWLDYGVKRGGGPAPDVPLGVIARANEVVRAEQGGESSAEVSRRLMEWGYKYDPRNLRSRFAQCSGFPAGAVAFWSDRVPAKPTVGLQDLPPDHQRYAYWAAQWRC